MFKWCFCGVCSASLLVASLSADALSQVITGSDLSHRSTGSGVASNWLLNENGYVGTYFSLTDPGPVTLKVEAAGSTNDSMFPHMNIVIADTKAGFEVGGGFNFYEHTFDLPAGTYFVRTEFNNDIPAANRQLAIRSLEIEGASSISNTSSTAINDANALSAADTYIEHFRQGPARVELLGAVPGSTVQVRMTRNAFNFGTMVQGFDANVFLAPVAPGDTTSIAARYQNFVNNYFNILVPSNMGKWQPNENTQGLPTMGHVDTILNYAENNRMNVRMHNLIWGHQQPGWVNDLIDDAQSSNPVVAATAKTNLMNAITNRIAYYVGDGDADTNDGDRAQRYLEIDVLNEALREGTYWDIFGADGIAEIYKNVKDAVEAAGAETRLYTNEYNIFNYANNPETGQSDTYANWYRENVEEINNAGFGEVVTGIGIQYIADARTSNAQVHSAARINQVMQNMAITGLPVTLTEFSVPSQSGGVVASEERSAQIYDESLRMMFGSPDATSFLIWEAWPPAGTDNTTIVDSNWNLRASGEALVALLEEWTTPTQELTVGMDGTVDFSGFYGDYELTFEDQVFELSLVKGQEDYSVLVALHGDFDEDGDVDEHDLTSWQDHYGASGALPWDLGDGDGDGDTDGADYLVWQRQSGMSLGELVTPAASNAKTVPEPSTLILVLLTLAWGTSSLSRPITPRR